MEVLVGLSPGKGDPFPAEVLFQRRSFGFDMPVLPLAQGGVEGSASLSLADLTGDGVPELVYIWGGGRDRAPGRTTAGYSTCLPGRSTPSSWTRS